MSLNCEQEIVKKNIKELIDNDKQYGITINSKGGVGKSYTIINTLKDYIKKNFVILTPTNKACNVIRNEIKNQIDNKKEYIIQCRTIDSFFGYSEDIDIDGNEIKIYNTPIISKDTIFIIDEISMIDNVKYSLLVYYIFNEYKYILLGDQYQLNPVKEGKTDKEVYLDPQIKLYPNDPNNISLIFGLETQKLSLLKNMRADNEKILNYIESIRQKTINNIDIKFKKTHAKIFLHKFVKKYYNKNYIIICYTNFNKNKINDEIRMILNDVNDINELDEYIFGDKIITNEFINIPECRVPNAEFFTINRVENYNKNINELDMSITLNCFKLYCIKDNKEYIINRVAKDDIKKYNEFMNKLKKKINNIQIIECDKNCKLKHTHIDHEKLLLNKFNRLKLHKKIKQLKYQTHNNISFAFAITTHKAQGSSFDYVFIDTDDINRGDNRLKYTAVSRTKKEIFFF